MAEQMKIDAQKIADAKFDQLQLSVQGESNKESTEVDIFDLDFSNSNIVLMSLIGFTFFTFGICLTCIAVYCRYRKHMSNVNIFNVRVHPEQGVPPTFQGQEVLQGEMIDIKDPKYKDLFGQPVFNEGDNLGNN